MKIILSIQATSKMLLIFLLSLFINNTQAVTSLPSDNTDKKYVVLLTSLNFGALTENFVGRWRVEKYLKQLEQSVSKEFSDRFTVITKHKANQFDLHLALTHRQVAGVFWISHGAYLNNEQVVSTNGIIDYNGFDITSVFNDIHTGLQFLAIIGCNSQMILHDIFTPQFQRSHPHLALKTFESTIETREGLSQSVLAAQAQLDSIVVAENTQDSAPKEGKKLMEIQVTRHFDTIKNIVFFPAIRIENQGLIVAVFPEAKVRPSKQLDSQTFKFPIVVSANTLEPQELKLVLDVGDRIAGRSVFEWGEIIIQSNSCESRKWKLFAKSNGEPFGITKRIWHLERPQIPVF